MAFHYSAKEFIKVYRKLLDWEWYTDVNTKTLFLHCLLRANWKAGEWHGIHYNEGEFITSLPSISRETGLSIRQARSALTRLETTGELTSRTTGKVTDKATGKTADKKLNKCRVITVNNWNSYQGNVRQSDRQNDSQNDSQDDSQSVNQTTGNRQATCQSNDSRYKNNKNIRTKEKEKKINKRKESAAPSPEGSAAALKEDPDSWWDSLEDETPEEWRRK